MRYFIVTLLSIYLLSSCKEDVIVVPDATSTVTMKGEFVDKSLALQWVNISGYSNPDEFDSLSTNQIRFAFRGQLETSTDFSGREWIDEDFSLVRLLPSGIQEKVGNYGFTVGKWTKSNGVYVQNFIVLFDDEVFTNQSIPWKTLENLKSDKNLVINFVGIWKNAGSSGNVRLMWKPTI